MTEDWWNNILISTSGLCTYAIFIPIISGLFFLKKFERPIYVFYWFCLGTLLINGLEQLLFWLVDNYPDIFVPYLEYFGITNTFFLQILSHIKSYLLLGWFFGIIFPTHKFKKYIIWISFTVTFLALINYLFIEGYQRMNVLNTMMSALFIIVLPMQYLWFSQRQSIRISLRKNPYLWFCLGLILPGLIGLFLDFTGDYIHNSDFILYCQLKLTQNFFLVLGQILIAIGFTYSYYAKFIQTVEI